MATHQETAPIWVVRESNEDGNGEGWLSFHRTEDGARAAMREIAEERLASERDAEHSPHRDSLALTARQDGWSFGGTFWWVEKETLQD